MKEFYEELAQHQIAEDWDFREVLENLHLWRERHDLQFKLEIPEVAIAIETISHWRLGQFRYGHNGFGFKGEITISRKHVEENLAVDRWWRVLGTLLHELLHAWQAVHGKPGKGNYHNVQFRQKARTLGLNIDQKGFTEYEPQSPFMTLLAAHEVVIPKLPSVETPTKQDRQAGKSKLRRWVCGCPIPIRVGRRHINVMCMACNQLFEPK